MLYTSYLNKINQIPDDAIKILVMQWKGKIDIEKYNLIWRPELSPSLFKSFRSNSVSKQEAFASFKQELNEEPAKTAINEIIDYLNEGKDVYIICCEKDVCECHRRIVAMHISEKINMKWEEFKGE